MTKTGKIVFTLFFVLLIFGLIVLSSAGISDAQRKFDTPYYYLTHQLLFGLLPGLVLMFLFSKIPSAKWRALALPLLIGTLGLMVLIYVPGLGVSIKGATRWLDLRFFTVQPAEFLKFGLVIYLAAWFSRRRTGKSAIPFFIILAITAALLVLQPDFGTLVIVIMISVAIYFFSGAKLTHFAGLIGLFFIALLVLSFAAPYRFNRIKTFFNQQDDLQTTGYHINQAKIAIGSGGLFGVGYGQSRQKAGFLPESVGDSIFAILAEELGFVGAGAFLALFAAFIFFLMRLAMQSHDSFSRLVLLGIAVWIGGQAFVNIAAISGLIPLTGVPLPLVSYGSSSLVSIMGAMGVAKACSQYINIA